MASWVFCIFLTVTTFVVFDSVLVYGAGYTVPRAPTVYRPSAWTLAHATFYGDESASSTMGTTSLNLYTISSNKWLFIENIQSYITLVSTRCNV